MQSDTNSIWYTLSMEEGSNLQFFLQKKIIAYLFISFILGVGTTLVLTKNVNKEADYQVTSPSPYVTNIVTISPSQYTIPSPTLSNLNLDQCVAAVNKRIDDMRQDACIKNNMPPDCSWGIDFVENPYKECYDKYLPKDNACNSTEDCPKTDCAKLEGCKVYKCIDNRCTIVRL